MDPVVGSLQSCLVKRCFQPQRIVLNIRASSTSVGPPISPRRGRTRYWQAGQLITDIGIQLFDVVPSSKYIKIYQNTVVYHHYNIYIHLFNWHSNSGIQLYHLIYAYLCSMCQYCFSIDWSKCAYNRPLCIMCIRSSHCKSLETPDG